MKFSWLIFIGFLTSILYGINVFVTKEWYTRNGVLVSEERAMFIGATLGLLFLFLLIYYLYAIYLRKIAGSKSRKMTIMMKTVIGTKMKKLLKGTPSQLSNRGILEGFTYLAINLPFLCNYRCTKCFNIESINIDKMPKKALNFGEYQSLISEAKDIGAKVIVLAGEGEPTLNENVKELVKFINGLDMVAIVYSNGSTLSDNLIKYYFDNNVTLVISFDSLSPALYLELTNQKNERIFHQVIKNIENAKKIYSANEEIQNGYKLNRLAIVTTVTSRNKDEIPKIKKFCNDEIYFICNPLANLGNAINNWNDLISSDNDFKKIREIVLNYSETSGPLTLDQNGLCGYSLNGIAVNPSGYFMTCAYTSLTTGFLGSIFENSIMESYEKKNQHESDYYKEFGNFPCLVRSEHFKNYVNGLKNSKKSL